MNVSPAVRERQSLPTQRGRKIIICKKFCRNTLRTVGLSGINTSEAFENVFYRSYGTIPYLGTFLTDLTMIDTAIPDVVSDGLINFDKRRKEFEVLAQVGFLAIWK